MIIVMGTVRVPREKLVEAKPAMKAMVDASRAEAGCLQYVYAEDVFEPGLIRVSEQWRDLDALKQHFHTPHIAAWRAGFPALGVTDRNLQQIEGGEPKPL